MAYQIDDLSEDSTKDEDEEVGLVTSALAGIYTGLWNVPKGFVSLAAELVDLGLDTNTAASTEKFFDDLNPFDDEAEARASGRITRALAQIAPIGVYGFLKGAKYGSQVANKLLTRQKDIVRKYGKSAIRGIDETALVAKDLAKRSLAAKKAGRSFSLANFGRKISKTGFGVVGGGIGEAIVADEEIGTLADMLKGTSLEGAALTMMDRETKEGRSDAYRRLMNRIKFGTEGALFNLGIIGAGKGIKRLRTPSKEPLMAYDDNPIIRTLQKYVQFGLKPEGVGTKGILEGGQKAIDEVSAVSFKAIEEGKDLIKSIEKDLFPAIEKTFFQKTGKAMTTAEKQSRRLKIMEDITATMRVQNPDGSRLLVEGTDIPADLFKRPGTKKAVEKILGKKSELVKKADRRKLRELEDKLFSLTAQRKTLFNQGDSFKQTNPEAIAMRPDLVKNRKQIVDTLKEIKDSKKAIQSIKDLQRRGGAIFKISNYDLDKSPQIRSLKKLLSDDPKKADEIFQPVDKIIKSFRAGSDNMSYRFLDNSMPDELAGAINSGIGNYLTTAHRLWEQGGLLSKFKPTAQDRAKSIAKRYDQLLKNPDNKNKLKQTLQIKAAKDVDDFLKYKGLDNPSDQRLLKKNRGEEYKSNLTKQEDEGLKIDTSVLKPRVLEEYQKIAAGEIKDPTYLFWLNSTKVANLNANTKFLNNMYDIMSTGKGSNKLMWTEEELLKHPVYKSQINNVNKFKKVVTGEGVEGLSPLDGLYLRAPTYDSIFKVSDNLLKDDHIVSQLYRYGVLAPKGVSQVSKTILSALTHARNFISAGAFAAANGILLPGDGNYTSLFSKSGLIKEGDKSLVGLAKDITWNRVTGRIPEGSRDVYERAMKVGVLGTQVEANIMKRNIAPIIGDPNQASADVLGRILDQNKFQKTVRRSKEVYGKIQDAYVAEDDFWKFLTWGVERNRHAGVLENYGVSKENFNKILKGDKQTLAGLVDATGKNRGAQLQNFLRKSVVRNYEPTTNQFLGTFDDMLDEIAGNIVRNNVPNYAYIGRTGQALRMSPFGNFIAFPLEVIRTGNNVYEQSIKEIKSGIPELAQIGWKRLFSFASTTAALPYAASAWFKNKHGVDEEEMQALRRYVPPWSKNSTLLPMGRDENGYLKYVDFSYGNAYDVLIRPFNAIMNEFANGDATERSLMAALGKGTADAFMEISDPFVSESIFTEAFFDSSIRRGRGLQGKQIWNEADDAFVKIAKGASHVASVFKPGSIDQFRRISDAATGKADKYGRIFNFEDEMKGLAGFRILQSDPERGLIYKTTQFAKNLKNAENLFTSPLLKGGRVTPEEILKRYKYSEQRRFETLKEMYKDIQAGKTLGIGNTTIKNKVKRRGISNVLYEELMRGRYSPKEPSLFFQQRIKEINRQLNVDEDLDITNPYLEARPYINEIIRQNRRLDLLEDELNIPEIEEQEQNVEQTLEPQSLSPTPAVNANAIQDMRVNANVMQTGLTATEQALLSPEEQVMRLRQRGIARA